jgi:hypothetical protein
MESVSEIAQLIPDSILFGSLLLYFLTHNLAYGVFGIFIIETVLSHRLISWISSQSVGPSRSPLLPGVVCRSGYKTPQFKPERVFLHDNYPSYGLYSVTAIATYLWLATKEFADTMDTMGPEWQSRAFVAYSLIGTVVVLVALMRWMKGCESLGEMVIATLLALLTGIVFYVVNKRLFGTEAMNFLGLPSLVTKDSQGAPIYVCLKETGESKPSA